MAEPVDLWVLCEHGEWKAHRFNTDEWVPDSVFGWERQVKGDCPGKRPASLADILAAVRTLDGVEEVETLGSMVYGPVLTVDDHGRYLVVSCPNPLKGTTDAPST